MLRCRTFRDEFYGPIIASIQQFFTTFACIETTRHMLQEIKKEFFAHRNGVVADALRRAGDPHSMIMGCQLADVTAIASRYKKSATLAQALWNDCNHRECRMAAAMLYPIEEFDFETATTWCTDIESTEIADVLCHRLLRHLPFAHELWEQLHDNNQPLARYTAWRLLLNLLLMNRAEKTSNLHILVENELSNSQPPLTQVLQSIKEEL